MHYSLESSIPGLFLEPIGLVAVAAEAGAFVQEILQQETLRQHYCVDAKVWFKISRKQEISNECWSSSFK